MALDFPSSPTNGQIYGNYYYDASVGAWNSFSSVGNVIPSTLKNLTVTTDDVGVAPFTVKNSGGTMVANIDNSGTLSANSLTLTNNLTVANGGTGAGIFTSGAYLKGNGTSAIQAQTGIPFGDVNVVSIPAATDLNTYITQGIYHQSSNVNAAGGTNYPVPYAGLLEVFVPGTSFLYQRYTAYKDQYDVYTRAYYNGAWNAWQKLPSGTVTVAEGGTGATTLTSGAYLKGAGTAAITAQTGIPATDITSGSLDIARGGTGVITGTGLTPIIPTSVSVSSGSGSVAANGTVTFSGANTVSVNGCFTADFLNYKIIFNQRSASTTVADGFLRLRSGTTDSTTGYYYNGAVIDNNTVQGNSSLGTSQWFVYTTHPSSDPSAHSSFEMTILQPFLSTVPQTFHNHAAVWPAGYSRQILNGGFNTNISSYNGFTMYLGSSQTFGGVFRIYGYN